MRGFSVGRSRVFITNKSGRLFSPPLLFSHESALPLISLAEPFSFQPCWFLPLAFQFWEQASLPLPCRCLWD
jgi:hypothetical protein